jgi:predicted GNAT family acetyltransferase
VNQNVDIPTSGLSKTLIEENGKKTKTNMVQGVYRCTEVRVPKSDSNLNFRIADERDIEKVGEWISSFHAEAVPYDPPIIGAVLARSKIDKRMIYVMEKNGDLVSMAAWSRDIETSCSVNLVYTPKAIRKKGYASLVTAKLTQHLLNTGKKETNLYTDMTNPTSNKIYKDIGYEFVCDSIQYSIDPHKNS